MADTQTAETGIEITPVDVNISPDGKVEIINPQLAERVKSALKAADAARKAAETVTNYVACGNNYQCGKALAKADEASQPGQIRVR